MNIRDYLTTTSGFMRKLAIEEGWDPASRRFFNNYELILALGEEFNGRPRPADWPRMTPNECFGNCWDVVVSGTPGVTYYEGLVVSRALGIPLEHAWLVDDDGRVIEVTLPEDVCNANTQYFGVAIDTEVLLECNRRHGYSSALVSDWMADNWLLTEGYKRLSVVTAFDALDINGGAA